MTGAEITCKLEAMSWAQLQAVDALCLLLDGLEREGQEVTRGHGAAECFVARLREYMGAFHFLTDALEDNGNTLGVLAQQLDKKWGEKDG